MNPNKAAKQVARHMRGLDNIFKVHPELTDSIKVKYQDTLKIVERYDSIIYKVKLDTVKIDSLLDRNYQIRRELSELKSLLETGDYISEEAREIALARIRELQEELRRVRNNVPTALRDTAFYHVSNLTILQGNKEFGIVDSLQVEIKEGELRITRKTPKVSIPIEVEVVTAQYEIKIGDKAIKIKPWHLFTAIGVLLFVLVLVLIKK